jgi:DNA-binding transcriptional LysR family regulator
MTTGMDLRHARTFVTVAELGTVSKAAARLHIAQPALSRQIRDLEQELGLKLFDRVGRRLVLTGEGEQLLGDCRGLLNCASSIGERAQQLRRGDAGILKVAASPQFIEGTLSGFLDRYTQRYPNVQVKVIEAIAWSDTLGMLERGEIHLGQNLLRVVQPDDPRFASHPLEAVDLLAASPCAADARKERSDRDRPPRQPSRSLCWIPAFYPAAPSTPPAVWQASRPISFSRAGHRIRCWQWLRVGTV